ncbi:MAG: bacteriohopanetetrol glucosamine biosynthesis glycosyltransferase HpnI [Bryobacteraceae bacterium]|nr:bacteriohopanetetrol glucosamine biosynthesis glycosyltransferase HpnI [Bryobacteraceae bacterium]
MSWLLLALVVGSLAYCVLTIVAARRHLAVRPASLPPAWPPVSVLKPLHGLEEGLESNLRTFFAQDYPDFELLFAVRVAEDPAAAVVEQLRAEYPQVAARLILTGQPPYPNAKVWSLTLMSREARNDLLVMSDSDIRATPEMLRVIAAEFSGDANLGVATCPYRAVPGRGSFWSLLEALGMNTEFWGSALVARMLEGMKFAVGPTIAARRKVLEAIGGFDRLKDYLAEDFVLGNFAAEQGHGVILSRYVVEHHIGAQPFWANARHRLRWNRSTRRSRPAGYVGQLFTNPTPLALLLVAVRPEWWPIAVFAMALRAAAAHAVSDWVLGDSLCRRRWYLIPAQDLLSFVFWLAGFFGNTILWRGHRYFLRPDGTFELRD